MNHQQISCRDSHNAPDEPLEMASLILGVIEKFHVRTLVPYVRASMRAILR